MSPRRMGMAKNENNPKNVTNELNNLNNNETPYKIAFFI